MPVDDQVHGGQQAGWIGTFLSLGIEETTIDVRRNVTPQCTLEAPLHWTLVLACSVHVIHNAHMDLFRLHDYPHIYMLPWVSTNGAYPSARIKHLSRPPLGFIQCLHLCWLRWRKVTGGGHARCCVTLGLQLSMTEQYPFVVCIPQAGLDYCESDQHD